MVGRKNKPAKLRKEEILEGYYTVMIQEGIEGSSIGKIADLLGIHPSLILHYFKSKKNLQSELISLMVSKFKSGHLLNFDHIKDDDQRFKALIETIFSYEWSRTVDPGVHYGFYYQSFRSPEIKETFREMFRWFRDYLYKELLFYNKRGIISVTDELNAADLIVTLMEGLEFHTQFLSEEDKFEKFAETTKQTALAILQNKIV